MLKFVKPKDQTNEQGGKVPESKPDRCPECYLYIERMDNFCSHCGKALRAWRRELKEKKLPELQIAEDADFSSLTRFLYGQTEAVPDEFARWSWALPKLERQRDQILIRLFNLDGGGSRTERGVAREMGRTVAFVRRRQASAIRKLRHPTFSKVLKGERGIPPE